MPLRERGYLRTKLFQYGASLRKRLHEDQILKVEWTKVSIMYLYMSFILRLIKMKQHCISWCLEVYPLECLVLELKQNLAKFLLFCLPWILVIIYVVTNMKMLVNYESIRTKFVSSCLAWIAQCLCALNPLWSLCEYCSCFYGTWCYAQL